MPPPFRPPRPPPAGFSARLAPRHYSGSVSLHLYDSLTRRLQRFEPLQPGRVGIYVCGPTVQAPPHVGHVRSAIVFDQLRRWLAESGYAVTYIRNVTDIDDKLLHDAGHEDI